MMIFSCQLEKTNAHQSNPTLDKKAAWMLGFKTFSFLLSVSQKLGEMGPTNVFQTAHRELM